MAEDTLSNSPQMWNSIVDHFRTRHKLVSFHAETQDVIDKWLDVKTFLLDRWFVPYWTPLFMGLTFFSQRNRNLFLLENNLNYRPWKFRYDDNDGNKY